MQVNAETLSAWSLVSQSDFLSKLILGSLFVVSVACVAIILFKLFCFWKEKRAIKELVGKLKHSKRISDLLVLKFSHENMFAGYFLEQALADFQGLKTSKTHLEKQDFEKLELEIDQTIGDIIIRGEEYLPFLGTSAAVAPLIGLFGTVWGLIHAFINISQERSADIVVVAPGIAEALTTTLAGLVVAIPAMIFFHYFSNELRKIEQQLVFCADRFLSIASKDFFN